MENTLINLLVYIVVVCLILGLVVWAADAIPVAQPFNKIIKVAATVIGVLIVILLLLRLVGITPAVGSPASAGLGMGLSPSECLDVCHGPPVAALLAA